MSEKPVLHYVLLSPPCRSVLLTAAAIGVDLDLKVVDMAAGENRDPEFVKVSSLANDFFFKSKKHILLFNFQTLFFEFL